jgi:hypothetical protein
MLVLKIMIATAVVLTALSGEASARIYRAPSFGGINDLCGIPCAPGWSYEYWPLGTVVGYGAIVRRTYTRSVTVRVRG